MRLIVFSVLVLCAASFGDIRPAAAKWSCIGADYVCGGSAKPSAKSYRRSSDVRLGKPRRAKAAYRSGRGYKSRSASRGNPASRRSAVPAARARPAPAAEARGVRSGQTGIASYYWQGQRVASGGRFNPNAMTAAHKSLPFGTRVRVTHLRNGRSVDVIINDRGPFVRGRVIDLSRAAAGVIGMRGSGLAPVRVDVVGRG